MACMVYYMTVSNLPLTRGMSPSRMTPHICIMWMYTILKYYLLDLGVRCFPSIATKQLYQDLSLAS
jgi:hypothetical protein